MGIFDKSKNDRIVEEYKPYFDKYVDSLTNNSNELNRIFMEITILRMKLDKNDSLLSNFKDKREREKNCERLPLIKLQFLDIMQSNYKYNSNQYELIDETMKRILPHQEQTNWWTAFWKKVGELFDKATGRKK